MNPIKRHTWIRRVAEYTVFWVASFIVLANHFAYGSTIERIDWIYTFLFHLSLWIGVSVNSFVLIPQFLARKRYVIYVSTLLITITTTVYLNQFTFTHIADWLFPGYYFISYFEWYDISMYVFAYLGITSLVQFSRSWFEQSESQRALAELKKAKVEQDLQSLKAQIQPHFLFNSLNTIYGLVRRKSDKAGEAVLTLSDLLRYTIKHAESNWVSLSDELEYLKQYLNLQRLRMDSPEKVTWNYNLSGLSPEQIKVIPLLFLPFVENAFKYGDGEIQVALLVEGEALVFKCVNPIISNISFRGTGTGIEKTRKLLELMYAESYSLEIDSGREKFSVTLRIPLVMNKLS